MKIISCYIENFGKLNKFTYDFNDSLNIIEEENGWGKTTFAAFIKAMFYGLEYHRRTPPTERKRYFPWNGNKFGGYIIFEKDDTKYKIERFFGEKPKSDTIIVYNMSRNTETKEFGDNPGETIWKVDRDSYEKTAFITLDDSSLLNDIISSKLGNIEDQEADLETSSKALKLLEEESVRIKAKRGKGGLVGTNETTVSELKQELRRCKNSLEKIEETEVWVSKEEIELEKINKEINNLEDEQSKLHLYEKKLQYKNLSIDFKIKTKEHSESMEFFKEKILSKEELNSIEKEAGKYVNFKERGDNEKLSKVDKLELEELENRFKENIPKLSEMDKYNELINNLSNKKTEINQYVISKEEESIFLLLDKKYKNTKLDSNIIDQYLDDINQVSKLTEEENYIAAEISKLKEENAYRNTKRFKINPLSFIGLILVIFGIVLLFVSPIVGVIFTAVGVIISILSFVLKLKNKIKINSNGYIEKLEGLDKRLLLLKENKENTLKGYLDFLESTNENPDNIASFLANSKVDIIEYNRLNDEIKNNTLKKQELENEISNIKFEIENYLNKYYDSVPENTYGKILSDLRNDFFRFQELIKAQNTYKETIKLIQSSQRILEDKLKHYYKEFPTDISRAVQELTSKFYDLNNLKNNVEEVKSKIKKFESDNNILELEKVNFPEKEINKISEDLIKKKKILNDEQNNVIKKIERHKKDINDLIQEADKIEDIESDIIQLEIDIKDLEKKHSLLSLTKECMIEAKENLAEKYMGDMSSNFKKYLEKLNKDKTEQYQIDINLDIKVEHGGKLYSGIQLSKGMKDLVQLCLRMALVESVYKDVDNPILVLDDPFINLDDDRLDNAIALLKEISLEYQIVYFICHSSRNAEIVN